MKLASTIVAVATSTMIFDIADAQTATLAQKWNISEDVSFEYSGLSFDLGYTVSDYILNNAGDADPKMARVNLFDQRCKEEGVYILANATTGIKSIVLNDDEIDPDKGVSNSGAAGLLMNRNVGVNITLDSESISENSLLYSEDTTGSQVSAEIRFCVRFGLHTKSATSVEVNFLETLVTLNVDLTDGFQIGSIAVEPRDRLVRTANQVYLVEAYRCKTTEITVPGLPDKEDDDTAINQGTVVRVCVMPDEDARADGIHMRSVDDFTWSRSFPNTVNQPAIVGRNVVARNDLTTLNCNPGDLYCSFETILFAAFYTTAGAVAGSGVASMQFGSTDNGIGRRNLRADEERMLQDDDAAAAAEFELDFDVQQATPYGTSSAASVSFVAISFMVGAFSSFAVLL